MGAGIGLRSFFIIKQKSIMTALQATSSASPTEKTSSQQERSRLPQRHGKSIKGRRFVPYKATVLSENILLRSVEGEYKYNRTRNLLEYDKEFGVSFTRYCEDLKKLRDVTILDSGAGQGLAMQDLIAKVHTISQCVCITKHRFQDVDRPDEAKRKMKWVFGRSEDYLEKTRERFNLITDLFGAYAYSPDRDKLIEHYYNHLKVGGKAFVFINSRTYMNNVIKTGNAPERLEEYLAQRYPLSFKILFQFGVLEITRIDESEIDLNLRRTAVIRKDNYPNDAHSLADKHKLDICYPQEVHFEFRS